VSSTGWASTPWGAGASARRLHLASTPDVDRHTTCRADPDATRPLRSSTTRRTGPDDISPLRRRRGRRGGAGGRGAHALTIARRLPRQSGHLEVVTFSATNDRPHSTHSRRLIGRGRCRWPPHVEHRPHARFRPRNPIPQPDGLLIEGDPSLVCPRASVSACSRAIAKASPPELEADPPINFLIACG
jgi:hypothetical protein